MQAAVHLAQQVSAVALVVSTVSGGAARAAAKYRPRLPVIALSEDERVRRQLALEWGVVPGVAAAAAARRSRSTRNLMLERGRGPSAACQPGDVVVLAYGPPEAGPSATSFLAVRTVLSSTASRAAAAAGRERRVISSPTARSGTSAMRASSIAPPAGMPWRAR